MKRRFWIRLQIFFRLARWGFAPIAAWFALGALLFRYEGGLGIRDSGRLNLSQNN